MCHTNRFLLFRNNALTCITIQLGTCLAQVPCVQELSGLCDLNIKSLAALIFLELWQTDRNTTVLGADHCGLLSQKCQVKLCSNRFSSHFFFSSFCVLINNTSSIGQGNPLFQKGRFDAFCSRLRSFFRYTFQGKIII